MHYTIHDHYNVVNNIYDFFENEWRIAFEATKLPLEKHFQTGSLEDLAVYREKKAVSDFLSTIYQRYQDFVDEITVKDYAAAGGDYVHV